MKNKQSNDPTRIAILVGSLLCLFFIYAFVGFFGGNDYLSQFVNLIISLFESTLTQFKQAKSLQQELKTC